MKNIIKKLFIYSCEAWFLLVVSLSLLISFDEGLIREEIGKMLHIVNHAKHLTNECKSDKMNTYKFALSADK